MRLDDSRAGALGSEVIASSELWLKSVTVSTTRSPAAVRTVDQVDQILALVAVPSRTALVERSVGVRVDAEVSERGQVLAGRSSTTARASSTARSRTPHGSAEVQSPRGKVAPVRGGGRLREVGRRMVRRLFRVADVASVRMTSERDPPAAEKNAGVAPPATRSNRRQTPAAIAPARRRSAGRHGARPRSLARVCRLRPERVARRRPQQPHLLRSWKHPPRLIVGRMPSQ